MGVRFAHERRDVYVGQLAVMFLPHKTRACLQSPMEGVAPFGTCQCLLGALGYLERHDVEAAVEYARNRHPNEPLALIGFSMGGAATLLSSVTEIQGLVLEAVYPTIRATILNRAR